MRVAAKRRGMNVIETPNTRTSSGANAPPSPRGRLKNNLASERTTNGRHYGEAVGCDVKWVIEVADLCYRNEFLESY